MVGIYWLCGQCEERKVGVPAEISASADNSGAASNITDPQQS
jgi:hypothetical protein